MALPRLLLALTFAFLAACTKQADLPDTVVAAPSPSDFTRFRTDLGNRFPPEQLKDFDTAIQELQLDAMNKDIATAAGREADMLAIAHGKTVHAVTWLGWQARRARFLRETALLTGMLENDLKLQAKTAAAGTPESVLARIESEKGVIAQLQRNLAATERRLVEMSQAKP